jgi:hypothetical protein
MGCTLIVLALLSAQAFANPCEEELKKNSTPLTFEAIEQVLIENEANSGLVSLPRKKLETFWFHTWSKLKARADEQKTKISDVIEEYFALGQSLIEGTPIGSDVGVTSKISVSRVQLQFLRRLEHLPTHAHMRDRDWYLVSHTYSTFMNLGVLAITLEPLYRESPTFHPLSSMTEKQALKIMDSLENSSLTHISRTIEERRQQFDPRRILGPRVMQVLSPIIGSTSAENDISAPEDQLALVLQNHLEFVPDFKYQVANSNNEDYTLTLAPDVVQEARHGQYDSIYKLLRSLVGGERFKTGIKILSHAGPDVVEVSNLLVGSQRLLGCLDGNSLRLHRLETVTPSTETTPANLCK